MSEELPNLRLACFFCHPLGGGYEASNQGHHIGRQRSRAIAGVLPRWDGIAHAGDRRDGIRGRRQEVDAVIKQAAAAGARITDPHDRFWGGYSGYFQDLDGQLWEIAWNPPWEVQE